MGGGIDPYCLKPSIIDWLVRFRSNVCSSLGPSMSIQCHVDNFINATDSYNLPDESTCLRIYSLPQPVQNLSSSWLLKTKIKMIGPVSF